jgi:hypothetical protein
LSNAYFNFLTIGGAGEGQQHLSPSGKIPNRPEVKTDEELPSFCHPPNPCPLGFEGMIRIIKLTNELYIINIF